MSPSPIVTDQLHKHNASAPVAAEDTPPSRVKVPLPEPKVWASVDLPSLNLSDPVGTTTPMPLTPTTTPAATLKNAEAVPTLKPSPMSHNTPLDSGLDARMAQLRSTSAALRRDAEAVKRTTGSLK